VSQEARLGWIEPEHERLQRPHQSLGYQTPDKVYSAGVGGGSLIVDRLGENTQADTT
jgi:uncharacterized protein (DUF2384 family)